MKYSEHKNPPPYGAAVEPGARVYHKDLSALDELEARKNAGHQDMKAAPAVEGIPAQSPGWHHCKKHATAYAPEIECPGCVYGWDMYDARKALPVPIYTLPTPVPVFMSTDSSVRKLMPVATGCLNYFPDALLLVAFVSRVGNEKHNPGQPLHWAKGKSTDEPDAEVRHMLDYFRGEAPDPGLEPLGELGHLASKAWRALAHLQRACDAARELAETTKGMTK